MTGLVSKNIEQLRREGIKSAELKRQREKDYQTKIDNMSKHNVGNLFDVRSIAKSRQLQDQKNFYSVEQSLLELEELLQSTRLYSFKEKTTDLIKRISGRDGDSYTIREMGKFISELVNELKLKYEVKE